MSKPGGPNIMPVNIICPPHFVQGGRSIAVRLGSSEMSVCGMMLPPKADGNATLSATDVLIRPMIGIYMNHPTTESLPNIGQFSK